ncbi:MAG TPA: 6-phosphofructokinase [Chloroflexota bacterium]
MFRGNLLVAQSGGPTPVLNSSLLGVVEEARRHPEVRGVYGGRYGIQGVLEGDLVDLGAEDTATLDLLDDTPSAALGSCRYRLRHDDLDLLLRQLKDYEIGYFLYIGGNDSALTSHRVARAVREAGMDVRVVGIPKTMDNDLPATDHAPGYGSVARFVAIAVRGVGLDTSAMRRTDPVRIVEVMGRHSGWLAASAALARERPDDPPHLIYVPERPLPLQRILDDVAEMHRRHGYVVVVLNENQPDERGNVLGSDGKPLYVDPFGHPYFDSPAAYLARAVQTRLGLRARYDRPGSVQRVFGLAVSETDRDEARLLGRAAVRYAVQGASDVIVVLRREPGPAYRCSVDTAPLTVVAGQARHLPDDFIAPSANDVTAAFVEYARPLIGGPLPPYARLRARPVPRPTVP